MRRTTSYLAFDYLSPLSFYLNNYRAILNH